MKINVICVVIGAYIHTTCGLADNKRSSTVQLRHGDAKHRFIEIQAGFDEGSDTELNTSVVVLELNSYKTKWTKLYRLYFPAFRYTAVTNCFTGILTVKQYILNVLVLDIRRIAS